MSAHDHFEIMRQSTMSHFSAPTLLSQGPTKIPNQRRLDEYRGTFIGMRDNQTWNFSLTTVNYGYGSARMTDRDRKRLNASHYFASRMLSSAGIKKLDR